LIIVFAGCAIGFMCIYFAAKTKYSEFLMPVDEKEYPAKGVMPAALYVLEIINYKYTSKYDRLLVIKTSEVYGNRYSQYFLRIHWANKLSIMMLGMLFTAFVGLCTGPDISAAVFGLIVIVAVFFLTDRELDEKIKRRRTAIQLDFPDFINKLTLLVNAGMTISRAWEKIVLDNKRESPLYKELEAALMDIQAGKPELQAYEDFAKRCRIPQVTKFVSVVIQNIRKGNSELVPILRLQGTECWEMRKNAAKRLGEEASTKMLLPMLIMFVAILIIVSIPAILAMRGI
jgi:tight adherence protein C